MIKVDHFLSPKGIINEELGDFFTEGAAAKTQSLCKKLSDYMAHNGVVIGVIEGELCFGRPEKQDVKEE